MYVGMFQCDGKVESLKTKFGTKHGVTVLLCCQVLTGR